MSKDPVESIWRGLSTDARDLDYVRQTLAKAGLFAASDFISVNVLGGEKRTWRFLSLAAVLLGFSQLAWMILFLGQFIEVDLVSQQSWHSCLTSA